jgi:redox-sensitive bicupin YhaK (pirin superfamily)
LASADRAGQESWKELAGACGQKAIDLHEIREVLKQENPIRKEKAEGEKELAFYVAIGSVEVDGEVFDAGTLAVANAGKVVKVQGREASRIMVVGGDNLGPRHMFWNFVSTTRERIDLAKQKWREQNFAVVPGDDEFIPLPA